MRTLPAPATAPPSFGGFSPRQVQYSSPHIRQELLIGPAAPRQSGNRIALAVRIQEEVADDIRGRIEAEAVNRIGGQPDVLVIGGIRIDVATVAVFDADRRVICVDAVDI